MKRWDTRIELLIERELQRRKIPYKKQVLIEMVAMVDFLLPSQIIIQCDGEYWHGKKIVKNRDWNQDFLLSFKGYEVFRLKESDILKSPTKSISRIMRKINV